MEDQPLSLNDLGEQELINKKTNDKSIWLKKEINNHRTSFFIYYINNFIHSNDSKKG
jgi:hypothetical protein